MSQFVLKLGQERAATPFSDCTTICGYATAFHFGIPESAGSFEIGRSPQTPISVPHAERCPSHHRCHCHAVLFRHGQPQDAVLDGQLPAIPTAVLADPFNVSLRAKMAKLPAVGNAVSDRGFALLKGLKRLFVSIGLMGRTVLKILQRKWSI